MLRVCACWDPYGGVGGDGGGDGGGGGGMHFAVSLLCWQRQSSCAISALWVQ